MQAFFTWFDAFLSSGSFWVYIVIFFGKVLEVSLCTLRIVLINRGERVKGSLIAIIEITLWLIIASSVLDGWKNDIGKAISYALAYAGGNYAGSWLDDMLAFGHHLNRCKGQGCQQSLYADHDDKAQAAQVRDGGDTADLPRRHDNCKRRKNRSRRLYA